VSLVVNLGMLGFFKYWNFFVESAEDMLSSAGLNPNLPFLQVVLPVGISFYTFQTLSYTIDIYRRKLQPEPNLARFALFVAFFPQLVAGPIERARNLLPQLRSMPDNFRTIDWVGSGALIVRGLFRKVVIADGVAPIVNQVFGDPDRYGSLSVAMGVLAFSLQIYGDFAGYTDIARGTARLFGIDLMENFRAPYTSKGFSEFWQRWHISLSTWLRDYLYIPLGGNRHGSVRTYINLMITMLLGGLWHGAGWGFVVWGGLHGLYLAAERFWRDRTGREHRIPSIVVFVIVTLTWIPFRSSSLKAAGDLVSQMFSFSSGAEIAFAPVALLLLGVLTMWIDRASERGLVNPLGASPALVRGLGYGAAIAAFALFSSQTAVPFIYFQF
jgi:D-alanyl-lipoteichoic acid acyltransferase DltB (MBOAT superfamily)